MPFLVCLGQSINNRKKFDFGIGSVLFLDFSRRSPSYHLQPNFKLGLICHIVGAAIEEVSRATGTHP